MSQIKSKTVHFGMNEGIRPEKVKGKTYHFIGNQEHSSEDGWKLHAKSPVDVLLEAAKRAGQSFHFESITRVYEEKVLFEGERFQTAPEVAVALAQFDILRGANLRLEAKATDATVDGFTIQIKTWGDTCVWSAGVQWIAHT